MGAAFVDKAKFAGSSWLADNTKKIAMPDRLVLGNDGFSETNEQNASVLGDFKPKSIQSANSSERVNLNVADALDFIFTFKDEGASVNTAKAVFYSLVIHPFFAPLLMLILYYYIPVIGRFFNLAFASFLLVLATLISWGVLFILIKFSQTATIAPELGIAAPVVALLIYAIYLVRRHY